MIKSAAFGILVYGIGAISVFGTVYARHESAANSEKLIEYAIASGLMWPVNALAYFV